jgi:hypothetical protein
MPTVSLNAFLKILSKNSPQKAAEYGRYLKPGGYDFYWLLKNAIRARTLGRATFEECSKPITNIDRAVEKKHNLNALKAFDRRLAPIGDVEFFEVPTVTISSPRDHLRVRLEPAFGYVTKDQRRMVHTWSAQAPALTQNLAACGLYLLKQNLCVAEYGDCVPSILDLRKVALYISEAIPPLAGAMVASEMAWADGFFESSAKAA